MKIYKSNGDKKGEGEEQEEEEPEVVEVVAVVVSHGVHLQENHHSYRCI